MAKGSLDPADFEGIEMSGLFFRAKSKMAFARHDHEGRAAIVSSEKSK